MSPLLTETRISFAKVAQEMGVHVSTVWRWSLRGIRGNRLECFSLGGRRYTSREAVERFVTRQNVAPSTNIPASPDRVHAVEMAETELDRLGM